MELGTQKVFSRLDDGLRMEVQNTQTPKHQTYTSPPPFTPSLLHSTLHVVIRQTQTPREKNQSLCLYFVSCHALTVFVPTHGNGQVHRLRLRYENMYEYISKLLGRHVSNFAPSKASTIDNSTVSRVHINQSAIRIRRVL